jgi:hypothetical protein
MRRHRRHFLVSVGLGYLVAGRARAVQDRAFSVADLMPARAWHLPAFP